MAIDFNAIMDQILASQDKANAANLDRYQQLLGSINTLGAQVGEQGTYGKSLALMDQVGTAGRQRITEQSAKAMATAEQDLTTRGLGNTTIREAVKRGTAHDAEMARQQMEESLAMQKSGIYQGLAGAQMQIGGMRAGAIEGRTDAGPNLGMFASLLSAAAAGEKADAAQVRTSRTLSARTAAGGPGTGWGGTRGAGGGGGGGIGQMGGGAGGVGGTAARPGTVTRMGGTGGGLNLAIDPSLQAGGGATGGMPSTPALAGAAAGKYTGEGYLADPEARAADLTKGATEVEAARQGAEAEMQAGDAGAPGVMTAEKEVITDYAEYKRRVGRNAVSAMYFDQVWGGKWSPGKG